MKYTSLLVVTLLLGCAFERFEQVLIDVAPLDEVTVTSAKRPEWPSHYFLCKRLYSKITQHGRFMNCIRGREDEQLAAR